MSFLEAFLIAIVEGLTEFLPVSSTGHMIIIQKLLGIESSEFIKIFTVNIQFGAILSVVVLYWKRFFRLNPPKETSEKPSKKNFLARKAWQFDFYVKLFIACIPAPVLVILFGDTINSMLENVLIVSVMLVAGGVFMLFVDRWFNHPSEDQTITAGKAFKIGIFQCIAMIPGVSRSMATIVGGMAQKLTREKATEFSFFLAVPTMFAASAYKLLGNLSMITKSENLLLLLFGNVVSFVVALMAIRWFIGIVTKYGFKGFGWYRIGIGAILLILLLSGVELSIV
ncbi:MAG: undecaprenyl-diphosphate phosphatase [Bacteroidales bacterium]|nr:undecaprenyl-diphosphate phosphatase [Bacteroidales bacterium]